MAEPLDHLAVACRVAADLDEIGASFAVVGGLAFIALAQVRTTKDVDFAVAVASDDEAETLVFGLSRRGYRPSALLQQRDTGRLATVRMITPLAPGPEPDCDLIFASCGLEPEIVRAAQVVTLANGQPLPMATRTHLIAMKLLSESPRRPNDRADLVALLRAASNREIADVGVCTELITARGFARDKDLAAVLRGILNDIGREQVRL